MGNTESLQLKEGKHILEIDEKILRDFQHCINVVDHTMTGLARSLDAMRVSCKLPFNNGDVINVKTQEQSKGRQENKNAFDPHVVAELHQILYDCVKDHEYVHMESLSKLFSFVLSISKDFIVFSRAEPFSFSVDRYLIQQNVGDNANWKQYYDVRIEALQKKIEDLKDTLKIAEEKVENLNEIEEIYKKEKLTLKSIIKKLDKKVAQIKSENDKEVDENVELLTKIAENEDLIISLEYTLKSLENELSAERKNKCKIVETLKGENGGYLRTINELQTTASEQTVSIENLAEEIDSLNAKNEKLSEEMRIIFYDVEEYKSTIDKLQRNINEMDIQVAELKETRKENAALKQSLEEERKSNRDVTESMRDKWYRHNTEKEMTEKKIKSLMEVNENLRANKIEAESKIVALEMKMEMLKNKKIIHVQDFQPFQFSAPSAKTDLFERIKNKMSLSCIELNVIQIERKSLVDPNVPLILNCFTSLTPFRRSGTIARQLRDLPEVTKKMAMVIYHHVAEKDLPREVELVDYEAGKDLWGVFNFGGFRNKIYKCPANEDTIDRIVDFLLQQGDVRYKASGATAL